MLRSGILLAVVLLCVVGYKELVEIERREQVEQTIEKAKRRHWRKSMETYFRREKTANDLNKAEISLRYELEAMGRVGEVYISGAFDGECI